VAGQTAHIRFETPEQREHGRREAAVLTLQHALKAMIRRRRSAEARTAKKHSTNGAASDSASAKRSSAGSRRGGSSKKGSSSKRPTRINYLRSGIGTASRKKASAKMAGRTTPKTATKEAKNETVNEAFIGAGKVAPAPDTPPNSADDDDITQEASPGTPVRAAVNSGKKSSPRHATPQTRTSVTGSASWDKDAAGVFKEGGVCLKLVGSKVHAKHMGIYRELETQYNRAPVFQLTATADTPQYMYYQDKSWMVSPVVGRKKCVIATTSPALRPDRVKSIWYEARGPSKSAMQGHPSIKAILLGEGDGVDADAHPTARRRLKMT